MEFSALCRTLSSGETSNMRTRFMIPAMLALLIATPAFAQETAPGRYTMTPAGEDMLRLDTKTGAVSRCKRASGNWVCKSVADDRMALENEIDRLSNENQRLRAVMAKRGLKPPPETKPGTDAPNFWLPDDSKVEEFMSFFEKLMSRFKQIADSMQDDASPEQP